MLECVLIWLLIGLANYIWFVISERQFIKNDFNNDFWVTLGIASIMLMLVSVSGPFSNLIWIYNWVFREEDF